MTRSIYGSVTYEKHYAPDSGRVRDRDHRQSHHDIWLRHSYEY